MISLPPTLADTIADSRWTRIAAGESGGTVHRLDPPAGPALFLKAGAGRIAADVTDEMVRLAWLAGRLPVPPIRPFVRTADAAWLLTEAMPGQTLDDLVEQDPAALPALIEPIAAFLRRLHALPVDDCPFDAGAAVRLAAARRNCDAGLVDEDDFDDDHDDWSAATLWEHMLALRPATVQRVVTHGDFSLGNILVHDGAVTGCIDVGRAGVADPYQDLAILWNNLNAFGDGLGDRFLAAYGVTAIDRQRLAFHRCLDEFF